MLIERIRSSQANAAILTAAKMCEPGLEEQVAYLHALDGEGIPYFISEFEEKMTTFDHMELQLETFVENILFSSGKVSAMSEPQPQDSIVGRGNRDGAELFRQWFSELNRTAEQGGSSAYVFVMGSMCEILRTFSLPVVFPEINSLQMAVRHVAHEYLNQAEDYGYSPDICGYVKADVAVQLRGGRHPMGRIPKPSIAVLTNACNTYIKWAEIWERMYRIPVFTLDIPGTRAAGAQTWAGDPDFENDRHYVQAQITRTYSPV